MEPAHTAHEESPVATAPPFSNFDDAVASELQLLWVRLRFNLWMVTRVSNDQQIVLHAVDHGYGVVAGTVLSWQDSMCRQMTLGNGPQVAPDVRAALDGVCLVCCMLSRVVWLSPSAQQPSRALARGHRRVCMTRRAQWHMGRFGVPGHSAARRTSPRLLCAARPTMG